MAVRRQVVHQHTPTVAKLDTVLRKMAGGAHFHFCSDRDCRLIYEDACDDPFTNGRCQACLGHRRNTIAVRDPQECCVGNCEQVLHPEDIRRYSLAGPGPWFQCRHCRRAHGWPCND